MLRSVLWESPDENYQQRLPIFFVSVLTRFAKSPRSSPSTNRPHTCTSHCSPFMGRRYSSSSAASVQKDQRPRLITLPHNSSVA